MNTNNQDDLNIIKNGIFSSKEHPKASADVCGIWFSTNNIESIENFSKKYSRSMDDIASTSKGIFTKKKRVAELLLQEGFVLIGDSNINDNTDILEGKKLKKKKV